MKKMMFNEEYGLQKAVILEMKDLTRRDGSKVFLQYEIGFDVRRDSTGHRETLHEYAIRNSPFKVGDKVAIAQRYEDVPIDMFPDVFFVDNVIRLSPGWSNKMYVRAEYMPHHIEITGARFEQLQCISDEDCLREGIYRRDDVIDNQMRNVVRYQYSGTPHMFKSPREAFASLIDKLSGKGTWDRNPYVYVYTFKKID